MAAEIICEHEPVIPGSFSCKKCGEDFSGVTVYSDSIPVARDVTPGVVIGIDWAKEGERIFERTVIEFMEMPIILDSTMPRHEVRMTYDVELDRMERAYNQDRARVNFITELLKWSKK